MPHWIFNCRNHCCPKRSSSIFNIFVSYFEYLGRCNEYKRIFETKMEKIVFTTGTFNMIHPGHIRFLNKAKELGDKLVVFLDSDKKNESLKGHKAIFSYYERAEILEELKSIDHVFNYDSNLDIDFFLQKHWRKDSLLFVKAQDYTLDSMDSELVKMLNRFQVSIGLIPYDKGYSTTKIFDKIYNRIFDETNENIKVDE